MLQVANVALQEAETGVIDLPDDDQQAVKMMMHYFYHLDYPQVPLDVELNALEDISMISSAQDIVDRPCEPEVDEDSWGGYVSMKKKKKAATNAKAAIPAAPAELACPPNFLVHAKVYAIAEKYAMEGLKALALQKFDQGARLDFEISDFVLGAKEAYTSTPDEIRPMRDAVVKVLGQRLSLFKTASVKQLLAKEQSLSYDVFMHLHG